MRPACDMARNAGHGEDRVRVEAAAAHRYIQDRKNLGKVVLTPE